MPFLNEMLAETERKNKNAEALKDENTSGKDIESLHLASKTRLSSRFQFDIEAVMSAIRSEIIGQEQAVQAVEDMLKVVRADIADPRRPLYTALLLGPTGVGKTELVRSLARSLYGDADSFCRVDMNTLSQEHYAASLTGAPPGYVGAKEGKTILDEEMLEGRNSIPGIVLLDEVEKASKEVLHALLNVFDNGMLTVASGEKTYSFRNSIIFMTSNLAAYEIQNYEENQKKTLSKIIHKYSREKGKGLESIVKKRLLNTFSPEFVNRIDNITVFNWIGEDAVGRIVELELEKLNRRLIKHSCLLTFDSDVVKFISKAGYDRQFGARSIRRSVRKNLEVFLAEYLLDNHEVTLEDNDPVKYHVSIFNGKVFFKRLIDNVE